MSKNEFIQGLEAALSGNVPPETVRENLIYYRDISGQSWKKAEQSRILWMNWEIPD